MSFLWWIAGGILAAHAGTSPTVNKLRAWIEALSWTDWGIGLAGTLIGLGLIAALGWWPGLVFGGLLAVIAAGVIVPLLINEASKVEPPASGSDDAQENDEILEGEYLQADEVEETA
mgnify:CR=1 FL=1